MNTLHLVAVTAGLSTPSSTQLLTERILDALRTTARQHDITLTIDVLNLKTLAYPLTEALVTAIPPAELDHALNTVEDADGLILVTPTYAGSYSGLFKTFMDFVGTDRINGTPVLLGATGGTARHSLAIDHAMRPLAAALRAHPTPTGIFAATEDFGSTETHLDKRITRAADELIHAAQHRPQPTPDTTTPHTSSSTNSTHPTQHTPSPQPVGTPGKKATIPPLDREGKTTTLKPRLGDFVPMTQLLPHQA